jgi:hypothetical protein
MLLVVQAGLLISIPVARAEESLNPTISPDARLESQTGPDADNSSPVFSTDPSWLGIVVIIIAGLFLSAAVIGPIVRAEMPLTVPSAMSHEEDPAADRH